jgi:hypothetical protein
MEAKSIQLYQLAHKKLHLVEKDAMEFVELIHENIQDQTKDLVTKDYLDVQLMELKLELLTKIAETEKRLPRLKKRFFAGCLPFGLDNSL